MDDEKPKHERRQRYKGTHPKSFQEKYKELSPEQYAADVAKVLEQGRTPAGMHRSICVDEILHYLNPQPGEIGFDATLGYGGHSLALLNKIQPGGLLYAGDVDPIELPKTKARLALQGFGEDKIVIQKMNFSTLEHLVYTSGPLNFILADLGVSSMQIDNPERGFSFKVAGPLDLRLNPKSGKSAADLLKQISQERLEQLLIENADEPYASQIAECVSIRNRRGKYLSSTNELQECIREALLFLQSNVRAEQTKKACQRCFQALRIAVNDEFGSLEKFLDKLPDALASGGRVAILSFHSGEDRRVKKSFQTFFREGIYKSIAADPIRASEAESHANPRARSAKLRWAVKA